MLIFSPEYTPGLLVPSCHAFGGEMEFARVLQSTMHHMIMNYFSVANQRNASHDDEILFGCEIGRPRAHKLNECIIFPKEK